MGTGLAGMGLYKVCFSMDKPLFTDFKSLRTLSIHFFYALHCLLHISVLILNQHHNIFISLPIGNRF